MCILNRGAVSSVIYGSKFYGFFPSPSSLPPRAPSPFVRGVFILSKTIGIRGECIEWPGDRRTVHKKAMNLPETSGGSLR